AFNTGLPHYIDVHRLVIEPTGRFLHVSIEKIYDYEIREVPNPRIRLLPVSQTIYRNGPVAWTVFLDEVQTTDTEVALGSSHPATVAVPVSVTIASGRTSTSFTNASSSFYLAPGIATITAVLPETLGSGIATARVTVKPFVRRLA